MRSLFLLAVLAACGNSGGSASAPAAKSPADPPPPPARQPPEPDGGTAVLEESAARYADLLIGESDSTHEGDMSRRQPGSDLAEQLKNVRDSGADVKVGGTGTGDSGRGTRAGTSAGPIVDAGPAPHDDTLPGEITVGIAVALDESSLPGEKVGQAIKSKYLAGLKRCYKEALEQDSSLRARLILHFTVVESGRVEDVRVEDLDEESWHSSLIACFEAKMETWYFDRPRDADGEATTTGIEVPLKLRPEL